MYPKIHSFPPFFTLQPNENTRQKQLLLWVEMIKEFCQTTKTYHLTQNHEIFANKQIDRKVTRELLEHIVDSTQSLEWNKQKTQILCLWFSVEEWAQKIQSYIESKSLQQTVLTGYEIRCCKDEEFFEMDLMLFHRVVCFLEQKKAVCLLNKQSPVDEMGIKFY
jgi:ESCRT-II complex subunit VPS25